MSLNQLAWIWAILGVALLLGVGVRWASKPLDRQEQIEEDVPMMRQVARIAFLALLLLVVTPIVGGALALVRGGGPPNDWSDLVLYVILVLAGGVSVVRAMPPGRMRRVLKRGLIAVVIGVGVGVGAWLFIQAPEAPRCGGHECGPVAMIGTALAYAAIVVVIFLDDMES